MKKSMWIRMFFGAGVIFCLLAGAGYSESLKIDATSGNVGIKTAGAPTSELDVNGTITAGLLHCNAMYNTTGTLGFQVNNELSLAAIDTQQAAIVLWGNTGEIWAGGSGAFYVYNVQGLVVSNDAPYNGNGNIIAEGDMSATNVNVADTTTTETLIVDGSQWPDYVFSDIYNLSSLKEVEAYVLANRHLPDIPTAEDIQEKGINVGEMIKRHMQKIEELTLYAIELKKENESLKVQLETENTAIKARLDAVEALAVQK